MAFSPDGKLLASVGWDKTLKIWDATTGRLAHTLIGYSSVAFHPDGSRIASNDGTKVILWDPVSGQEALTLEGGSSNITRLAFSADGKRIAGASPDGTIRVWTRTDP